MNSIPWILRALALVAGVLLLCAAILAVLGLCVKIVLWVIDFIGVWLDEHPEEARKR